MNQTPTQPSSDVTSPVAVVDPDVTTSNHTPLTTVPAPQPAAAKGSGFLRRCRGALRSCQRVVRNWPKPVRKLAIALLGVLTLLAGVVMLLTPGPGWVTIFLGLGILGTEFRWARRLSGWGFSRLKSLFDWCRGTLQSP